MVGMKSREEEEVIPMTEKSKKLGTVTAILTEAKLDDEQVKCGVTASHEKTTSLELGDLMAELEQIDKQLKSSEEDRKELKREIRYNKNENLDNCFNLARATEEKLQQMSNKVEATDKEQEKHIKMHMQEMKQQYDTVNRKLWNLETRIDTMSKEQSESSCAIQSKLDALLRNSIVQDKMIADKPQGNRVDFIEPQRNKWESTPLPRVQQAQGQGGPRQS